MTYRKTFADYCAIVAGWALVTWIGLLLGWGLFMAGLVIGAWL